MTNWCKFQNSNTTTTHGGARGQLYPRANGRRGLATKERPKEQTLQSLFW